MQYLRTLLGIKRPLQEVRVLLTGDSRTSTRPSFSSIFTRASPTSPTVHHRDIANLSYLIMEDPNIGYRSRSDLYLHKNSGAGHSGTGNDKVSKLPSTVDLTNSGWAPNPLSGPSTKRADAIEARALDMIAGTDALSETEVHKNTDSRENAQTRLKHWLSLSALSSTVQWKGHKSKANLKSKPRLSDGSDGSLVVVTVEGNDGPHPSSPGLQGCSYQPLDHVSTSERQATSFKAKITNDGPIQNLRLPRFSFENETDLLAERQGALGQEQLSCDSASQERVSAKDPSERSRAREEHSVPGDRISVFELPPPQYDLYGQREYENWTLNSGFFTPDDDAIEEISSDLNDSLVLSIDTSSVIESGSVTNDWRYVEQDDSFMGVGSPRASLMIEDIDSLIDEPVDLGSLRNTMRSSRRGSVASSGLAQSELAQSDCNLPTIYPGMDQYQQPSNCAGELNESWSNTSRSLFDPAPQYHHRVVSTPVHLRGGGSEQEPERFKVWRLFLGKKPVGDADKGKVLLESPVGIVDNFLLGRRGPPKTGRELCEETERRIEKGREIRRRREEKRAKKAGK
jgi:hypothetical protein